MTIDAQSTQPKTPSNAGNDSAPAVDLYQCGKCQTMLGRHRFQKKLFRKLVLGDGKGNHDTEGDTEIRTKEQQQLVCQQCRRLETANRCKQAPPKLLKHDSRRADSGTKRRPNNFGYCDYVDKLFGMDCFATHIAPLKVFTSAKDVSESMAAIQAVFKHGNISEKTPRQHDGGILCLCIGDGCTPRTALMMAFLAKQQDSWECVSIDPALSEEWAVGGSESSSDGAASTKGVRGLHCYKGTLKEFLIDPNRPPSKQRVNHPQQQRQQQQQQRQQRWRHLVLVCVHSHARFVEEASIENIRSLYSSETSGGGSDVGATVLLPTTIVSLPCCPTFRHVRDIGEPPTLKYDDDCVFSACRSVEVWNLEEQEQKDQTIHPGYCMATNAYCYEDLAFVPNGNMSTELGKLKRRR
jgi:hypothetical protein